MMPVLATRDWDIHTANFFVLKEVKQGPVRFPFQDRERTLSEILKAVTLCQL